jgi:hypothetical protein
MTKRDAIKRKAAWTLALKEGRVVRYSDGLTLQSFPTVERAEAEVIAANEFGAEIVKI